MARELIRGNGRLAERLGVTGWTVWDWKRRGLLDEAIMVEAGRVIVYDLENVFVCLGRRPDRQGAHKRKY